MAEELTIQYLLGAKFRLVFVKIFGQEVLASTIQGVITIDPCERTPLARTLLHELIHVRRPLWSEHKVIQEERRLWLNATWQEKAMLYKLLGKGRIVESQDDELEEEEKDGSVQSGSEHQGAPAADANSSEGSGGAVR